MSEDFTNSEDSMERTTARLVRDLVTALGFDEDAAFQDITNCLSAVPSDATFGPGCRVWRQFDEAAPDGTEAFVAWTYDGKTFTFQAASAGAQLAEGIARDAAPASFFERLVRPRGVAPHRAEVGGEGLGPPVGGRRGARRRVARRADELALERGGLQHRGVSDRPDEGQRRWLKRAARDAEEAGRAAEVRRVGLGEGRLGALLRHVSRALLVTPILIPTLILVLILIASLRSSNARVSDQASSSVSAARRRAWIRRLARSGEPASLELPHPVVGALHAASRRFVAGPGATGDQRDRPAPCCASSASSARARGSPPRSGCARTRRAASR